jgi:hypothetical protein
VTEPSITVTPQQDRTMYMHYVLGEAETDDGWKVEFSTTGSILLLEMTKDGERSIRESIHLGDLYGEWVEIALARRDTAPPPPPRTTPKRAVRKVRPRVGESS